MTHIPIMNNRYQVVCTKCGTPVSTTLGPDMHFRGVARCIECFEREVAKLQELVKLVDILVTRFERVL